MQAISDPSGEVVPPILVMKNILKIDNLSQLILHRPLKLYSLIVALLTCTFYQPKVDSLLPSLQIPLLRLLINPFTLISPGQMLQLVVVSV